MKIFEPGQIRNVGLYGHQGSGKTTLAEAMVYLGKTSNRLCSVQEGNSNFDFDSEEIRKRSSISAAVGYAQWNKKLINIVDVPGDTNFAAESVMAVMGTDLALIVVSAVDGVQVGTEKAIELLLENEIPMMVVVTKVDRERADYGKIVADLQNRYGNAVVPMALPTGNESNFKGIVDLVNNCAFTYADPMNGAKGDVPAAMASAVSDAREPLVEKLAEQDDDLMEKYFGEGELSTEDLRTALTVGFKKAGVIPVLPVNAATAMGVDFLMNVIAGHGPSPLDRKGLKVQKGDATTDLVIDPDGKFMAYVFKSIVDLQAGRISVFRVASGSIAQDGQFVNLSTGAKERFGSLVKLLGKKQEQVEKAVCGDIVAVVKLKETNSGHTIGAEDGMGTLVLPPLPTPCISFAVKPKNTSDEDKLSAAIQKIVEEDPGLRLSRDDESKEFLVSGLGQVHVQSAVDKLKNKFNVDVELKLPRIPYRETIRGAAKNVEGKHKKQSGGRGQFGVCYIDMGPNVRGSGFEFEDAIFGGSIPKQFIPPIKKGMEDCMTRGVVAGYPVVDIKVKLIDGKYHDVDSDARSFEMAGSRGFKAAFKLCTPIILEPIMELTIVVPEEYQGTVMGDISSRRGRIMGGDAANGKQIVKATVPMSECQTYASDLRSMTSDRGSFSMVFDHYEELPPNLTEKLIAEAKLEEDEE
ncbi:MAG TPA: elongation factor G [Myxococcota bacterium]|nr:elongation factor G [Myxococcota bacterium]HOH76758.1 elongation factor G [Myxococcota bacterium]